jgi:hypothetical protein
VALIAPPPRADDPHSGYRGFHGRHHLIKAKRRLTLTEELVQSVGAVRNMLADEKRALTEAMRVKRCLTSLSPCGSETALAANRSSKQI